MADAKQPPAPPAPPSSDKPLDEAAIRRQVEAETRAKVEAEMRAKHEKDMAAADAQTDKMRDQIEAEVRAKIDRENEAKANAAAADRRARQVATMRVEILRDVWPRDQTVENPNPLTTNEVRHRVGDVVDLPQDEALDLIELGAVKQYRHR